MPCKSDEEILKDLGARFREELEHGDSELAVFARELRGMRRDVQDSP